MTKQEEVVPMKDKKHHTPPKDPLIATPSSGSILQLLVCVGGIYASL